MELYSLKEQEDLVVKSLLCLRSLLFYFFWTLRQVGLHGYLTEPEKNKVLKKMFEISVKFFTLFGENN